MVSYVIIVCLSWRPKHAVRISSTLLERFNFIYINIQFKMEEELRKRLEYEEQFFGMSSQFFSDCFKNLILDEIEAKITMLVESFRGKLIGQAGNPDHFEAALKKMKEDLSKEYGNAVKRLFPEIEAKIASFIHIPEQVLLKEDLAVREGVNGDLDEIRKEIENLKGMFSSLLYLKQKMLEELEEADSAILFMEYIINKKKLDFHVLPVEKILELSKANNYLTDNKS